MNLWKRMETIPKTIRKRAVGGSNPSAGTSHDRCRADHAWSVIFAAGALKSRLNWRFAMGLRGTAAATCDKILSWSGGDIV